jgi:hypothetical protein
MCLNFTNINISKPFSYWYKNDKLQVLTSLTQLHETSVRNLHTFSIAHSKVNDNSKLVLFYCTIWTQCQASRPYIGTLKYKRFIDDRSVNFTSTIFKKKNLIMTRLWTVL